MSTFEKIKTFFITLIQFILVAIVFFTVSTLALLISWIIFLMFSAITLYGIF